MAEKKDIRLVFDNDNLVELYTGSLLTYDGVVLFDLYNDLASENGILSGLFAPGLLENAAAEFSYMGYSLEKDTFIAGLYLNLAGNDCEGFLAFRIRDGETLVSAVHVLAGDTFYGQALGYARSRYPGLKDLQLD